MVKIEENVSLRAFNTFGIAATAAYFTEVNSEDQLKELLLHPVYRQHKHLILGGGSNILFTRNFDGLVIKTTLRGIVAQEEGSGHMLVQAGSGENWHHLVEHCIKNNWGGIENLSLIPGTAGAAPMQNIGAYGVEIKDVIESVVAIDMKDGSSRTFSNADCRFNYRESVFKQELREKYFISSVTLRLTKRMHQLNLQYGALQDQLKQHHIEHPTINDVSDAVIAIRKSKLPDPKVVGNAGSFFKNPTIDEKMFSLIKKDYPNIPSYPVDNQNIKIPAGWLIEQCGWKGKRFGDVGIHPLQALVLVNYGSGKGEEIFELAQKIRSSVEEKFGVILMTEVNII